MRALRLHRWGEPLHLEEIDPPTPGGDEVLVEVHACGVGMTVLNCMRGDLGDDPLNLPRVPGHELVGTIRAVGDGVQASRVGELVIAYFYLSCGVCAKCRMGIEPLCLNLAGFLGVDRDGGYAQWTTLPARSALPLPPGTDPVTATTIPDAIATPVHVAARASIGTGDRVVVIAAAGGVGVHMVQVARLAGATVMALDVGPRKLAFLNDDLGVAAADSSDFDDVTMPANWRGASADVVVDLLGTDASLTWGMRTLAPGGRLVTLTTFHRVSIAVTPRDLVLRELSVLGSRYAALSEVRAAVTMVADGRVRPVIGRRDGAESIDRLHQDIRDGVLIGRGALVWKPT